MKAWQWVLALVAVGLAYVAFDAPTAEASTVCHASGNWCQGYAHVSTTSGGVASARCFALRTTNTAPTCSTTAPGITPSNEASWELDPGGCGTFYYFDVTTGALPPSAPNKVTIQVRFSDTGTIVRTFLSAGAEPANGSSYTFCSTSDGLAGSPVRAGTYRLFLNPVKDNGVNNYNINSDGSGSVLGYDRGALRGKMQISSIARSAYPAGSTFAYGPSGDETVTVTTTFTQPNGDNNVETAFNAIADQATLLVGQQGATVDIDATTTLAQGFVADSTFPAASSPYVPGFTIVGVDPLTSLKWTVLSATGHGAGVTRFSDVFAYDGAFNIDPRIAYDKDGAGTPDDLVVARLTNSGGALTSVYNRGEVWYGEWYLLNARGEQLTRSMTFILRDPTPTTCISIGSLAPSSGKYSTTQTLPTSATCTAAATDLGTARTLLATNTDQSDATGDIFGVSSLLYIDAHPQSLPTLDKDDFPTEDADETLTYLVQGNGIGGDASHTIHGWCHVKNVRKDLEVDTSGSAVTGTYKDPTTATRLTQTTDTASDGWTAGSLNLLATTPLGTWTWTCGATFNGNTGTDIEPFTIEVAGGGGETIYTGSDPLTVFALYDAGEDLVHVSIASRFLDGTARLDAEDEIFLDVYDSTNALVLDDQAVVELLEGDGAYAATFEPTAAGLYLVVAHTTDPVSGDPVGAHNIVLVGASALNETTLTSIVINALENAIMDIPQLEYNGLNVVGFAFFVFWWVLLFLFTFKWELKWCAAFTVPAILVFVVPDFGWNLLFSIICVIFGVLMQFLADRREEKRRREGTTDTSET